MNQAIQLPLTLDFLFTTQTKSVKPLIGAYVTKDRFNNRHSMAVYLFAFFTVNTVLHPVGMVFISFPFFYDERDLSPMTLPCIS